MEDQIINLVVAVDRISAIFRLVLLVLEKIQELLNMWYLPYSLPCVNIFRSGLCNADRRKGSDLTIVEA